ncbi:ribosome maturation factor RimP [Agilicoccus flavus]|uniref:ribosome maturation factor RimP n=1 Tax=Agilicoccus flavus TaxID=2775968 RepID=UPI001CF70426|nr:ribosome maturation factor RimP [Agilicoccus flavus]
MNAPDQGSEALLAEVAQAALTGTGLIVDHVTVTPAGRRSVVGVALDRDLADLAPDDHASPVPGVDLDTIADATRLVGDAFDGPEATAALGDRAYTLEVSTPGTSRPLTLPRHFRRNVGRLVDLRTDAGEEITGRIVAADPDGVTLAPETPGVKGRPAKKGAPRHLAYGTIALAVVQVEFVSDDAAGLGIDDDDLDDHTHDLDDHTHGLDDHTHGLDDHTHGLDDHEPHDQED